MWECAPGHACDGVGEIVATPQKPNVSTGG